MELNARLVGLGAGFEFMTPLHVVECVLHDEVPFFRGVFGATVHYRWKRASGETGENEYLDRIGDVRPARLRRYFGPDILDEARISNLKMIAADAKPFIEHAVALGRRGITMYVQPAPKPELFINKERVA
jgi:aminoglycoside 3-N-acetyltransferase